VRSASYPSSARALAERGVAVEDHELDSLMQLVAALWPRDRSSIPLAMAETGLARRAGASRIDVPVVVVGDHPRDWLLYRGLQTLRPLVYWLPASRLDETHFVDRLLDELRWAARTAGGDGP